jgi:hypothetical protein
MIAVLVAALFLQDTPPLLPPPPDAPRAEVVALDVDGQPVAPGKLPQSTSAEARAAWERLAGAVAAEGTAGGAVAGFDLALDLELRIRENQTNAFPDARYAYLAPGYLLADTGKGRRQVRGPNGDWLFDSSQPGERALVRLDVGRENAEDRRQLDEALDVARLFVLLVDPRNVRVARFAAAADPEAFVPTKLAAKAHELDWFELSTPDVRPGAKNRAGARILLGMARDSGLPVLSIADDIEAPRRVNATTACVELDAWKEFDGRLLPKKILVFLPRITDVPGADGTTARAADGWRTEPAMNLVLKSGSLNPKLTSADFMRPDPAMLTRPRDGK